jgi:hypothetical protein
MEADTFLQSEQWHTKVLASPGSLSGYTLARPLNVGDEDGETYNDHLDSSTRAGSGSLILVGPSIIGETL